MNGEPLTSATGPWAGLGWTYDRIGNRLSESQVGEPVPFTYGYQQNGLGGNTSKLTQIQPRPQGNGGGSITQTYGPAGNQTTRLSAGQEGSGRTATLTYSAKASCRPWRGWRGAREGPKRGLADRAAKAYHEDQCTFGYGVSLAPGWSVA